MVEIRKWLEDFIYGVLESASYTLGGAISLVLLLLISLLISTHISSIMIINETSLGLLNTSFTLLLVFVTLIYVLFTGKIVRQTNNAQKIVFIERKLEKFYFPMLNVLEYLLNITYHNVDDNFDDIIKKLDAIIPYQYLATDKSRQFFTQISSIVSDSDSIVHNVNRKRNTLEIFQDHLLIEIDKFDTELQNSIK